MYRYEVIHFQGRYARMKTPNAFIFSGDCCPWCNVPADTGHWTNVGLILAHCLRRWTNNNPRLVQCPAFTGVFCSADTPFWRGHCRKTGCCYTWPLICSCASGRVIQLGILGCASGRHPRIPIIQITSLKITVHCKWWPMAGPILSPHCMWHFSHTVIIQWLITYMEFILYNNA